MKIKIENRLEAEKTLQKTREKDKKILELIKSKLESSNRKDKKKLKVTIFGGYNDGYGYEEPFILTSRSFFSNEASIKLGFRNLYLSNGGVAIEQVVYLKINDDAYLEDYLDAIKTIKGIDSCDVVVARDAV